MSSVDSITDARANAEQACERITARLQSSLDDASVRHIKTCDDGQSFGELCIPLAWGDGEDLRAHVLVALEFALEAVRKGA